MGAVDDSVAALPERDRGCLQHVIDVARTLVPEAEEGMSYGMPALKSGGRFTAEHPLPDDVLADIVRLRRAEILK